MVHPPAGGFINVWRREQAPALRTEIPITVVGADALTRPSALMVAQLRRAGPARRAPLRRETRQKNAFAVFSCLPDGPQPPAGATPPI